jgi:hypothetical protein
MSRHMLAGLIVTVLTAGGFVACSEDAPVAPRDMHQMTTDVAPVGLEPFTFRAPIDPFTLQQQLPDFMIHSHARTDIVFQRILLSSTSPFGMWHTHPGPSFVYVIEGSVKVERFTKQDGCTEGPVTGPGQAYFEVAEQVHRAIVVSAQPAVLLVTRFNIPVGTAFTVPAADPGCS